MVPERFRLLCGDGADAVSARYPTLLALGPRVVVRDAAAKCYFVYASRVRLQDTIDRRHPWYEEVVFGAAPQKLRFDLDGLDPAHEAAVLRDLVRCAAQAVLECHGDELARAGAYPTFVGASSHKPETRSWHIVMDSVALRSASAVRACALRTAELVGPETAAVLDMMVYTRDRSRTFRMLGASKNGREKVVDPAFARIVGPGTRTPEANAWVAFGIGAVQGLPVVGAPVTDHDLGRPGRPRDDVSAEAVAAIHALQALPAGSRTMDALEIREVSVRDAAGPPRVLVGFRRMGPSMCPVCVRTHDHDTPFVLLRGARARGGTRTYEAVAGCHREPTGKRYVPLGTVVVPHAHAAVLANGSDVEPEIGSDSDSGSDDEPAPAPPERGSRLRAQLAGIAAAQNGGCIPVDFPAAVGRPEAHHCVRETEVVFPEFGRTLFVRAALMMGKTRALIGWLRARYPLEPEGAVERVRICVVSFRVAFTLELAEKIRVLGFIAYNDRTREARAKRISAPRVIIQIESIHRIDLTAGVDVLIIDEGVSVLMQVGSPHVALPQHTIRRVEWLLRNAGKLVLMDAHIGDQVTEIVTEARGTAGSIYYENLWSRQRALGKRYYLTCAPTDWLAVLRETCRARERFALATNSRKAADGYRAIVAGWWPGVKAVLISGDMPDAEKRRLFADLDKTLAEYDVVIYTPVMTAGNSIELRDTFQHVFGAFVSGSCVAETCMQMLARFRYPASGRHYILLQATPAPRWLPTTAAAVAACIGRQNIDLVSAARAVTPPGDGNGEAALLSAYRLEIDACGYERVLPFDTFAAKVLCANAALQNRSGSGFARRMVELCGGSGVRCLELPACDPGIRAELSVLARTASLDVAEAHAAALCGAIDITPEAAAELAERRGGLTGDDYLALARRRLLAGYGLSAGRFRALLAGCPSPTGLVKEMSAARTQLWFRLLRMTVAGGGSGLRLSGQLVEHHASDLFRARGQYAEDPDGAELRAIAHACLGGARDQRSIMGFAFGCARMLDAAGTLGFPGVFVHEPLLLADAGARLGHHAALFVHQLVEAAAGLCAREPSREVLRTVLHGGTAGTLAAMAALSGLLTAAYGARIVVSRDDDDPNPSARIAMHDLFALGPSTAGKIPVRDSAGLPVLFVRVGNGVVYR